MGRREGFKGFALGLLQNRILLKNLFLKDYFPLKKKSNPSLNFNSRRENKRFVQIL